MNSRFTKLLLLPLLAAISSTAFALVSPTVDPLYTAATGNLPQSGNWVDQWGSSSTSSPSVITVPSGADTYLLNSTGYVWVCDNAQRCDTTKPISSTTNGTGWVLGPISRIKSAPSGTIYVQAVSGSSPISGSIEWFKRQ